MITSVWGEETHPTASSPDKVLAHRPKSAFLFVIGKSILGKRATCRLPLQRFPTSGAKFGQHFRSLKSFYSLRDLIWMNNYSVLSRHLLGVFSLWAIPEPCGSFCYDVRPWRVTPVLSKTRTVSSAESSLRVKRKLGSWRELWLLEITSEIILKKERFKRDKE